MNFNPQWITLVVACTAMIASIAGPYVNTRIAKFQFRANVLSVNRQKWIETMRDLVASLNSQFLAAAAIRETLDGPTGTIIARDPELFNRVESLLRTVSKIELMLNPLERDHRELNALMKEGIDHLRAPPPGHTIEAQIEEISNGITHLSQEILKREWIRVKRGE
ncbi:MAG: hypothetical protein LDL25_05030 [Hyphomicrobiales bacterium]|uniref:hypothetical protein n=1 Tax=Rhabdaerophilum calidifontis TaxID=2604328 RepID=UPI00123935D1|nr:hypothetical protein [Rhabdaerophilum calidifontis]MCA1952049.1 hypothetical protein [Hyphomicrobiales bacterium]MCA1999131.1 hypothetical protein [Hyphomicrobiales bacterium]